MRDRDVDPFRKGSALVTGVKRPNRRGHPGPRRAGPSGSHALVLLPLHGWGTEEDFARSSGVWRPGGPSGRTRAGATGSRPAPRGGPVRLARGAS
eukprot:1330655-Pyramimonas_sp.AAC.1